MMNEDGVTDAAREERSPSPLKAVCLTAVTCTEAAGRDSKSMSASSSRRSRDHSSAMNTIPFVFRKGDGIPEGMFSFPWRRSLGTATERAISLARNSPYGSWGMMSEPQVLTSVVEPPDTPIAALSRSGTPLFPAKESAITVSTAGAAPLASLPRSRAVSTPSYMAVTSRAHRWTYTVFPTHVRVTLNLVREDRRLVTRSRIGTGTSISRQSEESPA